MPGYQPLNIKAFETGLVQSREEFILPSDAYPFLQNAFVWRERIKRKQGCSLLGRLKRTVTGANLGATNGGGSFATGNTSFLTILGLEGATGNIVPGSVTITVGAQVFTEPNPPDGTLLLNGSPAFSSLITYNNARLGFFTSPPLAGQAVIITFAYYPGLPVMGLCQREQNGTTNKQTIAFDQVYAYKYNAGWQEFIPGTTWNSTGQTPQGTDFFWSTNYWVGDGNLKIFWVTNFSGPGAALTPGDPIRYTNGTAWADFAPIIDNAGNRLQQCQILLPFRNQLMALNTLEGPAMVGSIQYPQRIRWSAIGNPFSDASAIVTTVNTNAWNQNVRGQGNFLDLPTTEAIVSAGFVRDNLVIYCERSTYQLRYTGRSIQPFQFERINSELGSINTFSAIQFDTSLVGIGDKAIVECDSFKSAPIDIKIPDFAFNLNNSKNGTSGVHGPNRISGIRDFQQRIAYWTYPSDIANNGIFPDFRLIYNYENDSWSTFTDSYTTLGTFQTQSNRTWVDPTGNNNQQQIRWEEANFSWVNAPALFPSIVGGNQQGYVEYLDTKTDNDQSLSIYGITGFTTTPTVLNSPNHNLQSDYVIEIINIPVGTPFDSFNDQIFSVNVIDADNFSLLKYNIGTQHFTDAQINTPADYVGGGEILIRDNFSISSKKFNFMDDGQSIQIGYIDILTDRTEVGEFSLNMYIDYNDDTAVNTLNQNILSSPVLPSVPDTFFNSVIPTSRSTLNGVQGSKVWQRIFCAVRGNFITLEYTFNDTQMAGINTANSGDPQEQDVQIDAQVLWQRPSGRMTQSLI